MFIPGYTRTRLKRFFVPSVGLLCLLLVGMLAGCGFVPGAKGRTLQGKLNLLRVPTPYSLPGQIVLGPDGNLWFSIDSYLPDYSAFGEMGRMTPQGAVTVFDPG